MQCNTFSYQRSDAVTNDIICTFAITVHCPHFTTTTPKRHRMHTFVVEVSIPDYVPCEKVVNKTYIGISTLPK